MSQQQDTQYLAPAQQQPYQQQQQEQPPMSANTLSPAAAVRTPGSGAVSSRSPKNARPGDILLVIHEFQARSEDELGLSKADRIQLIERDDDFGDGWYLGKHVQSGRTGLFPEAYTIIDPKHLPLASTVQQFHPALQRGDAADPTGQNGALSPPSQGITQRAITPPSNFVNGRQAQHSPGYNNTSSLGGVELPLTQEPDQMTPQGDGSLAHAPHMNGVSRGHANNASNHNSQVMTETLDVINEHITDMKKPQMVGASSRSIGGRRGSADSVSLYSRHLNQSAIHIRGEETDEEEEANTLTREEVSSWTPAQVAKHLERIGVEKKHCDVFQEQEFTGDVILGMEQQTIFLNQLDLGPIGRRLKTWNKIRALQDEVRASQLANAAAAAAPPSSSAKAASLSGSNNNLAPLRANPKRNSVGSIVERSPSNQQFPQHRSRPSAASVRELGQSRRHSSVENVNIYASNNMPSSPGRQPSHSKQGSFDQNWSMNGQQRTNLSRPTSGVHPSTYDRRPYDDMGREQSRETLPTMNDLDRGYASSTEVGESRQRGVLRKKNTEHNRFSSVGSERSMRSAQQQPRGFFRGGAAGGVGSTAQALREPTMSDSRVQSMYQGETWPRPQSEQGQDGSGARVVSGVDTINDGQPPAVTRLEYDNKASPGARATKTKNFATLTPSSPPIQVQDSPGKSVYRKGLRTISDAITGREKAVFSSPDPTEKGTSMDSSRHRSSEGPTGASTPSATTQSVDGEDKDHANASFLRTSGSSKRKTKKATSAYTRGLERKPPQEQMQGADFSGWMKKKSSNLMTNWKPRLFVLKGRRLSYYYTENDTEEKGLIDISNHRVLPANNDFITGLHATLTGVDRGHQSPTSPSAGLSSKASPVHGEHSPAVHHGMPDLFNKEGSKTFIFKLMPPRSGLQKAVQFTKPAVHYFAVPSLQEGRQWMAALMKATIDRDDTVKVITTYTQKTISLEKARARRERPPFLKNVTEEDDTYAGADDEAGSNASLTDRNSDRDSSRWEVTDVEPHQLPQPKDTPVNHANGHQKSASGSATNNSGKEGSGGLGLGIQGAIKGMGLSNMGLGSMFHHSKENSQSSQ